MWSLSDVSRRFGRAVVSHTDPMPWRWRPGLKRRSAAAPAIAFPTITGPEQLRDAIGPATEEIPSSAIGESMFPSGDGWQA